MTTTINPVVSINPSQLKDDVTTKLNEMGFTDKDIDSYMKRLAYRATYNRRPDVIAKRRAYNQQRNDKMKLIASLLK
jgi:hypothetical protein